MGAKAEKSGSAAIRIDKALTEMGMLTRSEAKKAAAKGRIGIKRGGSGEIIIEKHSDAKFTPGADLLFLDGEEVAYEPLQYYILNKPAGLLTATTDRSMATVMDCLPQERRRDLSPVGRLDRDTEGFLLITNDGALAHRLLAPKAAVPKVYEAYVTGTVTEADVAAFAAGLDIGDDKPTAPAVLEKPGAAKTYDQDRKPGDSGTSVADRKPGDGETPFPDRFAGVPAVTHVNITITEGRYHEIKRMFGAVGREVLYLRRLSMGPLKLPPDLPTGACRRLTSEEIIFLKGGKPC